MTSNACEPLGAARRPLVVVGEGGWTRETGEDCPRFCEANQLPVAASFRCQDYVDNYSEVYAGHLTIGMDPALAQRVQDADVLLAIGGRLGDVTTGGYIGLPRRSTPAPASSTFRMRTRSARCTSPSSASSRACLSSRRLPGGASGAGRAALAGGRPPRAPTTWQPRAPPAPGDADLGDVMATLRERLPAGRDRHPPVPATSRSGRTASTSSRSTRASSRPGAEPWPTASRHDRCQGGLSDRTAVCIAGTATS